MIDRSILAFSKRKLMSSIMIGFLLTGALVSILNLGLYREVKAADPTISVTPATTNVGVGEQFTVEITLDYAENLYGFELRLSFDNTLLYALSIEYMNYLNEPTYEWPSEVNNTGGYVSYAISSLFPAIAKTGGSPPPLIRINFTSLFAGTSSLHFAETILADDQGDEIPHTSVDGQVTSSPTISVTPATTNVGVGEQFTVEITLDYAENLYGFEVWLSFDNTILYAISTEYMNYLNEPTNEWHNEVNNTGGYVSYAISSQFPAIAKTGGSPPPLIRINFTSLAAGTSQLHFTQTILSDDQANEIPHTSVDGQVICGGTTIIHDVRIIYANTTKTGCKPLMTLNLDCTTNITMNVENQGEETETMYVSVYGEGPSGTIQIGQVNTSLTTLENKYITTVWHATGISKGNYTLWAAITPVPGEVDVLDNNFTLGLIVVTMYGDVTGDGKVNILDIVRPAIAFGSKINCPNYDPNADLNDSGIINILDIVMVAIHFGETDP